MFLLIKERLIEPLLAWYQIARAKREADPGGAMSLEALQREPIRFERDTPYADDNNPRRQLDIYLPEKQKPGKKLPVIVFFHGGGWLMGDKADGAGRLLPYVRSGRYIGVSAGYRLSDEAQWPAQLEDGKAAIRWLHRNGERYGMDTGRIAVCGRSAGGHLALMLGMTVDEPPENANGGETDVAAVVNFFGVTDIPALLDEGGDIDRHDGKAPEAQLIGGPLAQNRRLAKNASPVSHVSRLDAPVLTVHGTEDKTVPYPQAQILHRALQKAGVENYLVTIKGGGHENFGNVADGRVRCFLERTLYRRRVRVSTKPINAGRD